MFRILFYIFLVYLAYQFIQYFLIPVYKTTKQVKRTFNEMHDRANNSANEKKSPPQNPPDKNHDKEVVGEYIDFEEIK